MQNYQKMLFADYEIVDILKKWHQEINYSKQQQFNWLKTPWLFI